jgi:hypothetical protein
MFARCARALLSTAAIVADYIGYAMFTVLLAGGRVAGVALRPCTACVIPDRACAVTVLLLFWGQLTIAVNVAAAFNSSCPVRRRSRSVAPSFHLYNDIATSADGKLYTQSFTRDEGIPQT